MLVATENTITVYCIVKQGGSTSVTINKFASCPWNSCIKYGIVSIAIDVAGEDSACADYLSF